MVSDYATLVFDCDGVILDSNRVKTDAFRRAALTYGIEAADALVAYHVANGGISRYIKFQYFLEKIVPSNQIGPCIDTLLRLYADEVRAGLMTCAVAPGLQELRDAYPYQRWMIVSGGDQEELREIFKVRDLAPLFDGGIFGSPDTKATILEREVRSGNIRQLALFLGDSIYDHRTAVCSSLDFIFVNGWSEVLEWPAYVNRYDLKTIASVRDLLYVNQPLDAGL